MTFQVGGGAGAAGPAGPAGPQGPAGAAGSGMTLLSGQTLAVGANPFTLSAISQAYTHLKLILIGQQNSANPENIQLTFNNDSGANYDWALTDQATNSHGQAAAFAVIGLLSAAFSPGNSMGRIVLDILNYTSAVQKGFNALGGYVDAGPASHVTMASGCWRSNAAINRLDLTMPDHVISAGAQIFLYGI